MNRRSFVHRMVFAAVAAGLLDLAELAVVGEPEVAVTPRRSLLVEKYLYHVDVPGEPMWEEVIEGLHPGGVRA